MRRAVRQNGMCEGNSGGAERDRTADLLIANEALSQLSYGPKGDATVPASAGSGHLGPRPRRCQ